MKRNFMLIIFFIFVSSFVHAQSCKSILGASINRETILMEIASLSQDVEQAKLSGDTIAFNSLESSLKEKITEILNLGIISDEELKLFLNNQSEELIKKTKEELKEKKENREIQKNKLALITEFTNRFKFEDDFISWFEDFKNLNEADQKTIIKELNILKNQDEIIAKKIEEISLIWGTDLEIYKEIIKSKLIEIIDLNNRRKAALTSMQWAILAKQIELIEFLIQHGADVNAKNANGNTNLHFAVQLQVETIQKLLIQNNADINARNNKGETPLQLTFDYETIDFLLQNGADVNAKDNEGNTLLHSIFTKYKAPRRNKKELVKLLVKNGADVNAVNNYGEAPWDLASFYFKSLIFLKRKW